jgi:hypothetical protein
MAHRRRDLEKQLGNVNGVISKAVDALLGDNPSRALRKRLTALETKRDEVEAIIADIVPPAVEFHPNAANAYRDKVRDLKRALPIKATAREPIKQAGYISATSAFYAQSLLRNAAGPYMRVKVRPPHSILGWPLLP